MSLKVSDVASNGDSAAGTIALDRVPASPAETLRRRFNSRALVAAGLALSDAVVIFAARLAAIALASDASVVERLPQAVLTIPLWLGVFLTLGLFSTHNLAPHEEFRRLITGSALATVLVAGVESWALERPPVTPLWALCLIAIFGLMAERRVWRGMIALARTKGLLLTRAAIVGTDRRSVRLAYSLASPRHGFQPVGFVVDRGPLVSPNGLPVLGRAADIQKVINEHELGCLFVSQQDLDEDTLHTMVRTARRAGTQIRVLPNVPNLLSSRLNVVPTGNQVALSLRSLKLDGYHAALKRGFDLVLGSVALLVALPVIVAVSAAIRLSSPGPVLFRQERVTQSGRVFKIFKFRTMVMDADRLLEERGIDPTQAFFKIEDDPRLTKVGSVLRRLSLDELPQLLNVVRGEMSLVGPRPLPADQVEANGALLSSRHEVRAGLTGWWQINGRSNIAVEEALQMDLFYIDNWSLSLDLYIFLKTIEVVIARRGAI